jgi:DNA ligase D-like protein (predicted 3'-phosphoesterase)
LLGQVGGVEHAMVAKDHRLDYADFEGVLPEGESSGGAVIVWDGGSYDNTTRKAGRLRPVADDAGHLMINLHGRKRAGGHALQRIGGGEQAKWLRIEMKDEEADARRKPTASERRSVLSGPP